jgi:hypothetical protein
MEPAIPRDELIEKSLVIRQASFLFVALRQKLLAIPAGTANQRSPQYGDRLEIGTGRWLNPGHGFAFIFATRSA